MRRVLAVVTVCVTAGGVLATAALSNQAVTRQTYVFEYYAPLVCTSEVAFHHIEYTSLSRVFQDQHGTIA